MEYCEYLPEEINKLAKVKAQVTDVKCVMIKNIEKALDRGKNIEVLVEKIRESAFTGTKVSLS